MEEEIFSAILYALNEIRSLNRNFRNIEKSARKKGLLL